MAKDQALLLRLRFPLPELSFSSLPLFPLPFSLLSPLCNLQEQTAVHQAFIPGPNFSGQAELTGYSFS